MMVEKIEAEDWDGIDATLKAAQRASMAIKYSPVPVVAAPFGRVLGGGLEVCLHCARVQAHTDVSMGLVETSVGLVPAAGGIKEIVLRAMAAHAGEAILFPILRKPWEAITMAKTSRSALDAAEMGYLRGGDGITMNRESVIYAAKQVARALADAGWQPPVPATVAVQGRDGLANFHKLLHIVRGGDFISDHDLFLSDAVAWVLCGGDVDPGTVVDEQYLLDLERQAFLTVCRTRKTMERLQAHADAPANRCAIDRARPRRRLMKEAVIVSAVRTPVGKAPRGVLRTVRPETLAVTAIRAALDRAPGLDPAEIDDIIWGCAFPEAEQGLNLGRYVGLLAGLPESVPGVTVNRFCSSGLQAIAFGAQAIMSGMAEVILAGGTESMSCVPGGGNKEMPFDEVAEVSLRRATRAWA